MKRLVAIQNSFKASVFTQQWKKASNNGARKVSIRELPKSWSWQSPSRIINKPYSLNIAHFYSLLLFHKPHYHLGIAVARPNKSLLDH